MEILALSMIRPFLFAYSIPPVTFQISLPPTTYAYHLQTTTYNLGTLAASNLPPTTYTYHIQLINPCVMPGPQIPYSRGIDVYRHVSNSAVGTKKFVSLQGFFYPCERVTAGGRSQAGLNPTWLASASIQSSRSAGAASIRVVNQVNITRQWQVP